MPHHLRGLPYTASGYGKRIPTSTMVNLTESGAGFTYASFQTVERHISGNGLQGAVQS